MAFLGEGWSPYLFKEDSTALALGLKPQGPPPRPASVPQARHTVFTSLIYYPDVQPVSSAHILTVFLPPSYLRTEGCTQKGLSNSMLKVHRTAGSSPDSG